MTFGFLVFPGVEELDLVGPWEMVSAGIDLTSAFIAEVAGRVQFGTDYYPLGQAYGGFERHVKAPAYLGAFR